VGISHHLPFGRYRGRPLPDVPAGYLAWLLSECKLSSGLRAAVHAELESRPDRPADLPAKSDPPAPLCRRCNCADLRVSWQHHARGRGIRGDCSRCSRFVAYLPQTPENVAAANAVLGKARR
jgi:hypothetical protein